MGVRDGCGSYLSPVLSPLWGFANYWVVFPWGSRPRLNSAAPAGLGTVTRRPN